MEISNRYNNNSRTILKKPTFKGTPVAKVLLNNTTLKDEITLFKIAKSDLPFLTKMFEKIDLEKMYPNLPDKKDFERWKDMIFGAITNIEFGTNGFLAVRKNKPCAIISYSNINGNKEYYIDHMAAWPIAPNEGTKGSGKSLIRHLFDEALKTGKAKAKVVEEQISPRGKNCGTFYSEAGFTPNPVTGTTEVYANKDFNGFKASCENYDRLMEYKRVDNATDLDLNTALNLDY